MKIVGRISTCFAQHTRDSCQMAHFRAEFTAAWPHICLNEIKWSIKKTQVEILRIYLHKMPSCIDLYWHRWFCSSIVWFFHRFCGACCRNEVLAFQFCVIIKFQVFFLVDCNEPNQKVNDFIVKKKQRGYSDSDHFQSIAVSRVGNWCCLAIRQTIETQNGHHRFDV